MNASIIPAIVPTMLYFVKCSGRNDVKRGVMPNIVPRRITVKIISKTSPRGWVRVAITEKTSAAQESIRISLKMLFFVFFINALETSVPKKFITGTISKIPIDTQGEIFLRDESRVGNQ